MSTVMAASRQLVVEQTALPAPNHGSSTLIKAKTKKGDPFLVLASGEAINILDVRCHLQQTLPFELAFPLHSNPSEKVDALAFDPTTGRIAAHARGRTAQRARIGVWEVGVGATWRVHSSFVVLHNVTVLDFANGRLVAGGESTSVWELDESKVLPVWRNIGSESHAAHLLTARLSPSAQILATVRKGGNAVILSNILTTDPPPSDKPSPNALRFRCNAWHSLRIRSIDWRPTDDPSSSGPILFTTTQDGLFRIWGCMIDEPDFFSLWATIDVHTTLPKHIPLWTGYWRTKRMDVGKEEVNGVTTMVQNLNAEVVAAATGTRTPMTVVGKEGTMDEFVTIFEDGSVHLTLVENFDCRPPTCLTQSSSLLQDSVFSPTQLPNLRYTTLISTSSTSPTFSLISRCSRGTLLYSAATVPLHPSSKSIPFEKVPQGVSVNSTGTVRKLVPSFRGESMLVVGKGDCLQSWDMDENANVVETYVAEAGVGMDDRVVPWHQGRMLAIASPSCLTVLRLQHSGNLAIVASLPAHLPQISTFFVARPSPDSISITLVAITVDQDVYAWTYDSSSHCLSLGSHRNLSRTNSTGEKEPWSRTMPVPVRDSVAPIDQMKFAVLDKDGTLTFWEAEIPDSSYYWTQGTSVRTGKQNVSRAVCSADSLTAIVAGIEGGKTDLSIWDSKESEFTSGLQFSKIVEEEVVNMHWSLDAQTLAVATPHQVSLLCAQRLDDLSGRPGWVTYATVSVSHLTAAPISSLCWFASGLAISSAESVFFCSSTLSTGETCSTLAADLTSPLPYHHPQLLFQALLHGQTEVVIKVLVGLTKQLTVDGDVTPIPGAHSRDTIDLRAFLHKASRLVAKSASDDIFSALTNSGRRQSYSEASKLQLTEDGYQRLLVALRKQSMKGLSELEHAHLSVVVQTVYEIQRQQGALDADGLRYLISMRSFFIYNSFSKVSTHLNEYSLSVPRLKYRDIVWAFHSDSQELLVDASVKACPDKLTWENAKALGLFLWIKSPETMAAQMEAVGRAEYIKPDRDEKDPITAMLFYLALRKKHMITTFWKQANGHSDQRQMIKLLANDFDLPRWRSAALKNAFVLLSKQRFLFAAAFFLLGDSLKDCVNVCLRQLDDFQLAIAITRVYEGDDGPVLQSILEGAVLPLAFKEGYRWLASWSFWMLKRRDLAIETIVTPLADLASRLPYQLDSIGSPMHEDPNLAQLFRQLRSWSLQTVKGASAVLGKTEFNFVLHMSRVLCRMGCHVLALDLVQSWQFVTPQPARQPSPERYNPRHSLRRLSTKTDIDIPSNLGSRAPSPDRAFHKVLKETKAQTQAPPEFDFNSFTF